jgi:hypothetical protein
MAKYTDKPWNGSKSRFTIEELLRSIPRSMAAYAKSKKNDKGEVSKSECHLPYHEPDGAINIHGISSALGRAGQVKGPSSTQKASARAELERANSAARKALGKPEQKSEKAAINMERSYIYDLDDLIMAVPVEMLQYAIVVADRENRDITEQDLKFPVLELDGTPNLYKVKKALSDLNEAPIPTAYKASIRCELLAMQREIETELGEYRSADVIDPSYLETLTIQQLDAHIGSETSEPPDSKRGVVWSDSYTSGNPTYGPTNFSEGTQSNDMRPYPDFRKLGIDRPAGPATDDEIKWAKGHTKIDGSPVHTDDFFSAGALLANNDLIEDRYIQIPSLELARIGSILEHRAKGSDENHDFTVHGAHFRVVNPKIGVDLNVNQNQHSVLRNIEPYTALIGRAVFPLAEQDQDQIAAVEKARRGLISDLSMTPSIDALTCGLCYEKMIEDVHEINGKVHALKVRDLDEGPKAAGSPEWQYFKVIIRSPHEAHVGGYKYTEREVLGYKDGIMSMEPFPNPGIKPTAVVMHKMQAIPMMFGMFGAQSPKYCPMHGLQGGISRDGRRVVALATNVLGLINVAAVSAGAINDSRLVLDPDVKC